MTTNRQKDLNNIFKKILVKQESLESIIDLLQEAKELGFDVTSVERALVTARKSFDRFKNKVFFSKLKEKDKLNSQLLKMPYKERVYTQVINRECITQSVMPLIQRLYEVNKPFSLEQLIFLNRSTDTQIKNLFADDLYIKRIKKKINERPGN